MYFRLKWIWIIASELDQELPGGESGHWHPCGVCVIDAERLATVGTDRRLLSKSYP